MLVWNFRHGVDGVVKDNGTRLGVRERKNINCSHKIAESVCLFLIDFSSYMENNTIMMEGMNHV